MRIISVVKELKELKELRRYPRSAGFAIPPQLKSGFIIRYGVANPVLDRDGLQIRHNWEGSWVVKSSN